MEPQKEHDIHLDPLNTSIDSVLETSLEPHARLPKSKHPHVLQQRPLWIGPTPVERPRTLATEGQQAMKHRVVIEFATPGLIPPVYVFTNLSDPEWSPVGMDFEHEHSNDDEGFRFFSVFNVEPGEYQYKFRLGPGDWWICDESKDVVYDDEGNCNNRLTVGLDGEQEKDMENTISTQPSSEEVLEGNHDDTPTPADENSDSRTVPPVISIRDELPVIPEEDILSDPAQIRFPSDVQSIVSALCKISVRGIRSESAKDMHDDEDPTILSEQVSPPVAIPVLSGIHEEDEEAEKTAQSEDDYVQSWSKDYEFEREDDCESFCELERTFTAPTESQKDVAESENIGPVQMPQKSSQGVIEEHERTDLVSGRDFRIEIRNKVMAVAVGMIVFAIGMIAMWYF